MMLILKMLFFLLLVIITIPLITITTTTTTTSTNQDAFITTISSQHEAVMVHVWWSTLKSQSLRLNNIIKAADDDDSTRPKFDLIIVVVDEDSTLLLDLFDQDQLIHIIRRQRRPSKQDIDINPYYKRLFYLNPNTIIIRNNVFQPFSSEFDWFWQYEDVIFNGFVNSSNSNHYFRTNTHIGLPILLPSSKQQQQDQKNLLQDILNRVPMVDNQLVYESYWDQIPSIHRGPKDVLMVITESSHVCNDIKPTLLSKISHIVFESRNIQQWPFYLFSSSATSQCSTISTLKEYIRLWIAIAFSPSLSRTRLLLATFLQTNNISDKLLQASIQASYQQFKLGQANKIYYEFLSSWLLLSNNKIILNNNLINIPLDRLFSSPNFGIEVSFRQKYLQQPIPVANVTQIAKIAKQLHTTWINTLKDNPSLKRKMCYDDYPQDQIILPHIKVHTKNKKQQKILYVLITHSKQHERARKMLQTCLSRVDSLLVLSDREDPIIGSVKFYWDGIQSYDNLWHIMKGVIAYVGQSYFSGGNSNDVKYDWLALLTDDSFIIPENIQTYVDNNEKLVVNHDITPIFIGKRLNGLMADVTKDLQYYISGGPLRLLNRKAVQALDQVVIDNNNNNWCGDDPYGYAEDIQMTKCLAQVGIFGMDTRGYDNNMVDEKKEMIHAFPPDMMLYSGQDLNQHPSWKIHSGWWPSYIYPPISVTTNSNSRQVNWQKELSIGPKYCCDPYSMSFHLYLKNFNPPGHDESLYSRLFLWWYGYCIDINDEL
jgi:hypothetical protein